MLYLNDTPITPTIFPDKTSQVWKLPLSYYYGTQYILWKFESEAELMHLAQLVTLVRELGAKEIVLDMPYLPYARQDKPVRNHNTFALRVFAAQLNALKLDEVRVLDPHSNVAAEFIDNFQGIEPVGQIYITVGKTDTDLLCYPDRGAKTRYSKIITYPHIYGEKVRDQSNGNITKYDLEGDPKGHTVLIVDDICDGGMTFVLLAKQLLQAGAKEVNLYVTHGIFSKGLEPLKEAGINRIFTYEGERK